MGLPVTGLQPCEFILVNQHRLGDSAQYAATLGSGGVPPRTASSSCRLDCTVNIGWSTSGDLVKWLTVSRPDHGKRAAILC